MRASSRVLPRPIVRVTIRQSMSQTAPATARDWSEAGPSVTPAETATEDAGGTEAAAEAVGTSRIASSSRTGDGRTSGAHINTELTPDATQRVSPAATRSPNLRAQAFNKAALGGSGRSGPSPARCRS